MVKKIIIGLFSAISIFVMLIALAFGANVLDLKFMEFFGVRRENVRREIFEETKSYTHGKIQDLAKYYDEHRKAGPEDRAAIESVVKMHFANFDVEKIQNYQLKQFLVSVRGY